MKQPSYVTRSRMPQQAQFLLKIEEILQRAWLTNNGQCVQDLEQELKNYLGVSHLLACNNGTTALMLAIQCAGLAGKKIAVTPYSYVATLSALLWLNCTPVFVDIEPDSLCLSPEQLSRKFTEHPDIAGVIPVHIYGLACDVERLEAICLERGAVLIYDAAQAFGSCYKNKSLLDYGDYSICSFHATKVFHTAEGGCVISHTDAAHEALSLARAFGHTGDVHSRLGINGKMSELHAALGLVLLHTTEIEIEKRRHLHKRYDAALAGVECVNFLYISSDTSCNYAYYPLLLPDEAVLLSAMSLLQQQAIYPRRYFYPALNTLPYLEKEWKTPCPVAEDVSRRVLCLPLYGDMDDTIMDCVVTSLKSL